MTIPSCVCLPTQSPSSGLIADTSNENPKLMDNWDDAEGYYSKCPMTSHDAYSISFATVMKGLLVLLCSGVESQLCTGYNVFLVRTRLPTVANSKN